MAKESFKPTKQEAEPVKGKASPAVKKQAEELPKDKHAGGRPPKFKTPQELQTATDEYFESCWFEKVTENTDKETGNTEMSVVRYQQRPYTVAGLAYDLDMTTQALRDYQAKDEFLCIIKRAKQKIEMNFEENLCGKNPTGSIFWLKNHAGYKDKHESEITGANGGPVKIHDMSRDDLLLIASGSKKK